MSSSRPRSHSFAFPRDPGVVSRGFIRAISAAFALLLIGPTSPAKPSFEPRAIWRHVGGYRFAIFSPDGKKIAAPDGSDAVRIWDAFTGKALTDKLRHDHWVTGAAFSPDGTILVTVSEDGTARLWDTVSGKPLLTPFRHGSGVRRAEFSADGARLFCLCYGMCRTWDVKAGAQIGEPFSTDAYIIDGQLLPDGKKAFARTDRALKIWEVDSGQITSEMEPDAGAKPVAATVSANAKEVLVVNDAGQVRVWDAASRKPIEKPKRLEAYATQYPFSRDGTKVATLTPYGKVDLIAGSADAVRIWSTLSGKMICGPLFHRTGVHVYDPYARPSSINLDGGRDRMAKISDAAFSPDARLLATGGEDETLRIWRVADGQALGPPRRHDGIVASARFSPDGKRIATDCEDGKVRIWKVFEPRSDPIVFQTCTVGDDHDGAIPPDRAKELAGRFADIAAHGDSITCDLARTLCLREAMRLEHKNRADAVALYARFLTAIDDYLRSHTKDKPRQHPPEDPAATNVPQARPDDEDAFDKYVRENAAATRFDEMNDAQNDILGDAAFFCWRAYGKPNKENAVLKAGAAIFKDPEALLKRMHEVGFLK